MDYKIGIVLSWGEAGFHLNLFGLFCPQGLPIGINVQSFISTIPRVNPNLADTTGLISTLKHTVIDVPELSFINKCRIVPVLDIQSHPLIDVRGMKLDKMEQLQYPCLPYILINKVKEGLFVDFCLFYDDQGNSLWSSLK